MMKTQPFIIERTLNATPDRVWKAITNRDEMEQWYFNLEEFRPEVGFEFDFVGGSETQKYLHKCKVTAIEPGHKLSHTWTYKGFEGHSVVTWELAPYGNATRVKLTHEGLETFPKLKDFARESFSQGWTYIVGKSLPEYLEKVK